MLQPLIEGELQRILLTEHQVEELSKDTFAQVLASKETKIDVSFLTHWPPVKYEILTKQ